MQFRSLLPTSLVALAAVGALAMAPSLADVDGSDDTGAATTHGACAPVEGATVVTPDTGFDGTVPTPIGAGISLIADAGLYQIDLSGLDDANYARVRMELSWDTPLGLGDYDLRVNGHNQFLTTNPEVHTLPINHCGTVDLSTVVFTGTPADTLTLRVTATPTTR